MSDASALSGPPEITLSRMSPRGPLAGSSTLPAPQMRVPLVNAGLLSVKVVHFGLDPLRATQSGAVALGGLRAEIAPEALPFVLEPGSHREITVSGSVPARQLRVRAPVLSGGGGRAGNSGHGERHRAPGLGTGLHGGRRGNARHYRSDYR